jgi:hypothetical protein
MASSARKKAPVSQKRLAAGKDVAPKRKRRTRRLVDDVTAILLISPNPKTLCEFYRALGIPLEDEVHDGVPLHYGCALGDVQFAIHPADSGWPGVPTRNAQSPVIAFSTSDLKAVAKCLSAKGIETAGPTDHGFAQAISFRDPDGNFVSILEYGPEYW